VRREALSLNRTLIDGRFGISVVSVTSHNEATDVHVAMAVPTSIPDSKIRRAFGAKPCSPPAMLMW
jgi:hypothetical protein